MKKEVLDNLRPHQDCGAILCTWLGCREHPAHDEVAKDGEIWARLCCFHHDALETALASGKIPVILATWVKAQGGPKSAAKRMTNL